MTLFPSHFSQMRRLKIHSSCIKAVILHNLIPLVKYYCSVSFSSSTNPVLLFYCHVAVQPHVTVRRMHDMEFTFTLFSVKDVTQVDDVFR